MEIIIAALPTSYYLVRRGGGRVPSIIGLYNLVVSHTEGWSFVL